MIISTEWVLVSSIMIFGLIAGLTKLANATNNELTKQAELISRVGDIARYNADLALVDRREVNYNVNYNYNVNQPQYTPKYTFQPPIIRRPDIYPVRDCCDYNNLTPVP